MAGAAAVTPLLEARGLTKHFPLRREGLFGARAVVRAVDDVSFAVAPGETLGIVGESGCGKSTSARVLIRLIEPDSGEVAFDGARVDSSDRASIRALRRQIQMVFQNSHASLNPRLSVEASIAFAPRAHGVAKAEALRRAHDLLAQVGLEPRAFAHRYPHELSGGQRQRVNIARALALSPRLLLLDEPVSALDKSVQAQVLNLLSELKATLRLTYVFISHDLGVVQYVSDRVLVMYLGKIVEIGPVEAIYAEPRHPYTAALLAAMPTLDPDRPSEQAPLQGDPPSPIDPPPGCRFSTRCPFAEPLCRRAEPPLLAEVGRPERLVACHMANPGSGHGRAGGR